MLIDAQKSDFVVPDKIYDACICGAGFAGISIARELAKKGKSVALLEAGGVEYSDRSQDIYSGKTINGSGLYYWNDVADCRIRYFGGTSAHWAGLCYVPDAIDFEDGDRWGLPGWPIRKTDLDGYFDRAAEIIDITGQRFEVPKADQWDNSRLRMVGFVRSPPTRLNEKYLKEVTENANIDCFVNCNTVDIRLNGNLDHATELVALNYDGKEFRFRGKQIVIACGAIENARLLLSCNSQVPNGIGNHSDYVGRCFMEHLDVPLGRFVTSRPDFWDGGNIGFKPSRELMVKSGVLNAVLSFQPDSNPETYGRLRVLKRYLRDAACSSESLLDLSRQMVDFDCPGDGVITTMCEQAPNRESRITLGQERDSLGQRRVILNWQINALDRKTIRLLAMESAREMARQNIARVQLKKYILDDEIEIEASGHCHQMGTTRMSENPKHGVVDRNSRVHGITNLYMAGSSVFSTGGGNNPTLEIVLLSLRLADHLSLLLEE